MDNYELHKSFIERYLARTQSEKKPEVAKTTKNLPKIKSIPVPASFGSAFFLQGDFGKEFLKEYNGRVKRDYQDNSVLKVLNWNEDEELVTGSNPFAVVLANEILQTQRIRTATQADLEKIMQGKLLDLQDHYEDSSLVWRSNTNPNEYLAKSIQSYANTIGVNLKIDTAYVFPLYGLDITGDKRSPQKLHFILKGDSPYFEAPILNSDSNTSFESSDIDKITGLPVHISTNGNRNLYRRNSGLSRLYLGWNLYIYSYNVDLSYSNGNGRVVCISPEATQPKKFVKP